MLEKIARLSWIYDAYRLAQSTAALDSGNAIYQQILLHVVDGFDAQSGCLALCDPNGILGWVAQEDAALLLNGCLADDPRFSRCARTETDTPHSAICWPLKVENVVIGAVSVNRCQEQPPYLQQDLEQGTLMLNLISLVLGNIALHRDQQRRIDELKEANLRLEQAQNQLLQTEKLASIGQLAAGVAHEINNPIGFVSSNLGSLEKYLGAVFQILHTYEVAESELPGPARVALTAQKKAVDLDFLKEDIPLLIAESREGLTRVRNIVQSLKNFSHTDSGEAWQLADLHAGLDSTIKMAWNTVKHKASVVRHFGGLPLVECLPSQLNQVFLNILINAVHAIPETESGTPGTITISTSCAADRVLIVVSDTGCGIPARNLSRIFDPFFTTKKVGDGTGLGLSVSYGIIQKHSGTITVASELGIGSRFTISLPIRQSDRDRPLTESPSEKDPP